MLGPVLLHIHCMTDVSPVVTGQVLNRDFLNWNQEVLMDCYLSMSTRSSLSRAQRLLGQKTFTRLPESRVGSMWRAWASWFTVWRGGRGGGVSLGNSHHFHLIVQNVGLPYTDAPPLVGRLCGEVRLVSVGPFNSQETVGGVADAAGQHAVSQHGVDHSTLPVTGPESHTSIW